MFGLGVLVLGLVPDPRGNPGLAPHPGARWQWSAAAGWSGFVLSEAVVIAAGFGVTYALLSAALVRLVSPLIRPGWHPDLGVPLGVCGSPKR
jgi:hypothetical protein